MTIAPGTLRGHYEILSPLGAGGMGEVFRARDTKLGRDVALKILPDTFTSNPERLARFKREAQLLASLNHPHIGAIYGLEDVDGQQLLVLELVDGETLADRIAHGAIPVPQTLAIARQIAGALEAAHEKGIIHRDLKPANIALTHDGTVKVLDFGLAKATDAGSGSGEQSASPTITSPALMTGAGVILGTAAYMSPEQARGRIVDKRSDVWAFGCVLFEMLTGKRAFDGDDVTDTIAAIVRGEPDWQLLPKNLPPNVDLIIRRCLEKDRKQRFSDISVPLFLLNEGGVPVPAPRAPSSAIARVAVLLAVTALLAAAIAVGVMWRLRPAPPAPMVTRFPIVLPEGQTFSATGRHTVGISPDGTQIVYASNRRLYVRKMSESEAHAVTGMDESPTSPVFSPDGRWIAYFGGSPGDLRKVAVAGGTPVTLCPATNLFGIVWQGDDILFSEGLGGITRVSANGGTPEQIVTLKDDEVVQRPELLPGGESVLFSLASRERDRDIDVWDHGQVVVQSLKSGKRTIVVSGGSDARYVPSGHILYAVSGVVFAVPFDVRRLAVTGGAVPVIEGVSRSQGYVTGAAQFSVSNNGTLAYVPGPASISSRTSNVGLLDRAGHVERLKMPTGPYETPRVSPDGRRIAVATDDGKQAIVWIYDLSGATARRQLTFGGRNRAPVWSADGQRVAFQSDRDGDLAVFWQRADGNGPAERLTKPDKGDVHVPQSFSPDGKALLVTVQSHDFAALWTVSLQDGRMTQYVRLDPLKNERNVMTAAFSPDGRWVAYATPLLGTRLQPFPADGTHYKVAGGVHPFWSPDGHELFANPRGALRAVTIAMRPEFTFKDPVDVQTAGLIQGGLGSERNMDVLPDGKRFVAIFPEVQPEKSAAPQIQVVERWFEELKARVPTPR